MKYQQNQHFSHHHVLNSLKLEQDDKINCDGCEQDITEPFHGCIKCSYYLHDNCLNTPRSLEHPSHPSHPLTLHSTPTYSCRSYTCNACDSVGNGFSLSCALCEFDIHLQCANLPNYILIDKHPHELKLFFGSPYSDKNTVFECDICRGTMNPHHWLYYCAGCDFGSHLDCVNGKPRQKEKPQKGKGRSRKPEAENVNATSQAQQGRYSPSVDDINGIREAEAAIHAARVKAMLAAQEQEAILDLWDSPRRNITITSS